MRTLNKSWRRGVVALAVTAALGFASTATYAAGDTSGLVGSVQVAGGASEYTVVIKDPQTGFTREVSVDSNGNFRFNQLPVGEYEVTVSKGGSVVARDKVRVALGSNAVANFDIASAGAEVIEVVGARPSAVDLFSSDSGLTIGEAEFDSLPVARNTTAVALLSPGAIQGDTSFGNLPSFSGSSVAENVCYINGMNVTDPDKGLGCGSVPFEFYKEFQIKTGGYSAQYGRSTGGVINAVTKSGTNEFEFAANVYHEPDSLRGDGKVVRNEFGREYRRTDLNTRDRTEISLSAGGPIVQDKVFFYVLVNPRLVETETFGGASRTSGNSSFREDEDKSTFWGAKLDWNISDSHRLEYFGFSDDQTTDRDAVTYNPTTRVFGTSISETTFENGGTSHSLKYVGNVTDSFTISAMIGQFEINSTTLPGNQCPAVADDRPGTPALQYRCGVGGTNDTNEITRDIKRLDFEWAVSDDHMLRFGYDSEEIEALHTTSPTGGASYAYSAIANGATILGTTYTNNTGAAHDYVSNRVFEGGGAFTMDNYAIYIEDEWTISDQWFASLGLRSDVTENAGRTGVTFVEIDDQIAPRIGVTFDPTGDGTSKFFANYGRYYLPVPVNTNYRVASGISDITTYYRFTGVDTSNGAPTGLTQIAQNINSSGAVPDRNLSAVPELEAMYLNEYILGYQHEFSPEYSMIIRAAYRDTANAIDDYCDRLSDPTGHGNICMLFNPGEDATFSQDGDGDGHADPGTTIHYTAEQIGMPKAKRTYESLQFELNHKSAETSWTAQYVWSRLYGNNEGGVKSDNEQTDTGITTDFDFVALMDGAEGYLPNDRRHVFKFYGSHALTDDLRFGWNSTLSSGRPISPTGRGYPGDTMDPGYGDTYYTCTLVNGNCVYTFNPRGSGGRTPWLFDLGLSLTYSFNIGGADARAMIDVFNVLDSDTATKLEDRAETSEGTRNPMYGLPRQWQNPRTVRLGFEVRF